MKKVLVSFMFLSLMVFFISCESKDVSPIDANSLNDPLKSEIIEDSDCFDQEIGHLSKGEYLISKDLKEIKLNWENVLNKNTDLSVSLDEIYIVSIKGYYFLEGVDFTNHSVSVIPLVLKNGKFYEQRKPGGGYTVTCSGCTSTGPESSGECEVSINPGNGYYCTDCSSGTCTKTTTYEPGGIL